MGTKAQAHSRRETLRDFLDWAYTNSQARSAIKAFMLSTDMDERERHADLALDEYVDMVAYSKVYAKQHAGAHGDGMGTAIEHGGDPWEGGE